MTVYAIKLNDAIVAVTDDESRADKMAAAVKANEGQHHRHVFGRPFELNKWPEHWAGKEEHGS